MWLEELDAIRKTENMTHTQIIIIIIVGAGLLGGLTNFFLLYKLDYKTKECWINFFKSIFLSLCASLTVPLFLQIISNNLIDIPENGKYPDKNYFVLTGFCVLAAFYSKRFLEDVYSKLNKLEKKVEETKQETTNTLESVTQRTETVIKKVEDLEESTEEIESDNIPTEIKDSIVKYKSGVLAEIELEKIVQSLVSNKYSFRTISGINKDTEIDKERVKKILDHLVDHGFAEKKVGSNGKDFWRILKYPIRIYSATYLWPNGQVDVTSQIKGLVLKGIYQGTVSPSTFGIPDPIHGTVKVLRIHCRIHGQEKELDFKDGQTFNIA